MRDIPIIFSGPMVCAHLEGRKTMTRRLAWGKPWGPVALEHRCELIADGHKVSGPDDLDTCICWSPTPWQRVKIGDRLWIRETVACGACAPSPPSTWSPSFWRREQGSPENRSGIWYKADDLAPATQITERGRWISPIHMPRWCSRLTLIVTGTKIERVQDISFQDVRREGCEVREFWLFGADAMERQKIGARVFGNLWSDLHGQESWDANPEVVAISYRVIKANIDAPEARAA